MLTVRPPVLDLRIPNRNSRLRNPQRSSRETARHGSKQQKPLRAVDAVAVQSSEIRRVTNRARDEQPLETEAIPDNGEKGSHDDHDHVGDDIRCIDEVRCCETTSSETYTVSTFAFLEHSILDTMVLTAQCIPDTRLGETDQPQHDGLVQGPAIPAVQGSEEAAHIAASL